MIDLHCHTNNSDGTWSTTELLTNAQNKGITTLSITDHDTTNAYFEIDKINIKDYYQGKIITGVEINCVFQNTKIELLGYGVEKENLQKWLDSIYGKEAITKNMIKEFNDMIKLCKQNKIKISDDISFNPESEYPIDIIYFDIIKYLENKKLFKESVWNSKSIFFRKCTADPEFILFRDFTKDYPKAEEVSKIIRENGGKVFLAHLFVYELKEPFKFIEDLYNEKIIDGVECYYSKFTLEQTKQLESFCEKFNLLKSGGSDCHGEKHPNLDLGIGYGNLIVNEKAINEWI